MDLLLPLRPVRAGVLDALQVPRAVLAGYDWGGRAACVVAALWPQRCAGLVSYNNYNIQDIARGMEPAAAHARRFTGPGSHRVVPDMGHNMPQEAPRTFAAAVLDLVATGGKPSP